LVTTNETFCSVSMPDPKVEHNSRITENVLLRSSGFAVTAISNTTCTTLPKIISPSTPVQSEACHCEDSYMLLILCRECLGSNSYIPYRKDWSLPRHFGSEAEGQGPMKIIKRAQALWRLKASVTYKSTDWPRRFRGLKARVP
jgi:hypothetical protein